MDTANEYDSTYANQEQKDKNPPIQPTEEAPALEEEGKENTGMDMGTAYKEDMEQDLDDLVHRQGSLQHKNEIPPPEES